ncbi:unnamed protein product, partial [Iphiclides podalirius]
MACGSFSPPTFMHLRMFEIARDYIHSLGLGTVIGGIVSPVHDAYGKKDLVAAHHRISMLQLAVRSSGWIKVSEWETQQPGWTRTKLSLQYHQDTINSQIAHGSSDPPSWMPDDILNVNSIDEPDDLMLKMNGNCPRGGGGGVTVRLLCGADLLESFATPGLWADEDLETIVGKHGLVVVTRAGCDPGRFIYESDMLYKHRRNVMMVTNYVTNEVSSTVLRRLVRRGESAKYLTEDAVLAYIRQNGLYGATPFVTEYNLLSDLIDDCEERSSPEETSFKNILISIRDRPTIIDETVTVKRSRRPLLPKRGDSVSPSEPLKPRAAYSERADGHLPGRAVQVLGEPKVSDHRRRVSDGCVGLRPECAPRPAAPPPQQDGEYKTRSCNDIVRLVLTKHGIHVISDTEAIV